MQTANFVTPQVLQNESGTEIKCRICPIVEFGTPDLSSVHLDFPDGIGVWGPTYYGIVLAHLFVQVSDEFWARLT